MLGACKSVGGASGAHDGGGEGGAELWAGQTHNGETLPTT